jgi:hypothetical protein
MAVVSIDDCSACTASRDQSDRTFDPVSLRQASHLPRA